LRRLTIEPSCAAVKPIDDSAILQALDAKDYRRALRLLMAAYGDSVYSYCGRILGKVPQVDDVHQLVWIQAYDALPTFARRSSLRTWLFGIANHRCLDAIKAYRRLQKRVVADGDRVPEAPPVQTPSAERKLDHAILAAALDDCLARLPTSIRMALLLRFHEEFTFEEMSMMTNEKPGTLQARVSRAMPLLRDCLAGKGIGHDRHKP
jgi:RNA polymerase sigma-70 factor (ECF subfamily)